jgi:hypothetical protein
VCVVFQFTFNYYYLSVCHLFSYNLPLLLHKVCAVMSHYAMVSAGVMLFMIIYLCEVIDLNGDTLSCTWFLLIHIKILNSHEKLLLKKFSCYVTCYSVLFQIHYFVLACNKMFSEIKLPNILLVIA